MRILFIASLMLFSGVAFARDIRFEIHWHASGDASVQAKQEQQNTNFVNVNANPVFFNTLPGSVNKRPDGAAIHSISAGYCSDRLLLVGDNVVDYAFEAVGVTYLTSGSLQSILMQEIHGGKRELCQTLIVAGQPAQGSCRSQLQVSLNDLDPDLASRLSALESELIRLKKYSKVDGFRERFKYAKAVFEELGTRDFEHLNDEDLDCFGRALDIVVSLRQDISQLEEEIRHTQTKIKENLEQKKNIIRDELRREGVEDLTPPTLEMDFPAHQAASFPESCDGDTFNQEDNIYKSYASKVLANLKATLSANNRLAFLAEAESWMKTIGTYEKLALNQPRFSKKEWLTHLEQYDVVYKFIDEHVDSELWFRDSPVPIEVRQALRGQMRDLASIQSSALESALKTLSKKDASPAQQRVMELVKGIQKLASGISKAANETVDEFRELLKETAEAVAEGITCFAKAQISNRIGSFYELVTGKSQCDGSELSTTERVLAGVELALGTPKLFAVLGTVIGVGSYVAKAEKIIARASNTVIKVENMKEFFKTPFGARLTRSAIGTSKIEQGQKVYRLTNDFEISESLTLVSGTQFYLDAQHKDHLEVFRKSGKALMVLNLDGTTNLEKTRKALKERRRI